MWLEVNMIGVVVFLCEEIKGGCKIDKFCFFDRLVLFEFCSKKI